ncbi:MAG TPA: tubulin-like doman-containing protein [Coleofasciculaceae cyanobacterium]
MAAVEEKTMVPTVIVGIGGTGTEILSRVRRLVEETYGSLKNFPILSFLTIDTDRDYKVTNPLAAGSAFKDNEKHWASVSGSQVKDMIANMDNYPWINSWFPRELERNINALEAGAGQIRACGRFAYFCNYHAIQKKFIQACDRVKGKENFMLDRYGVKVSNNQINVFITGSLSGGTGSGMLIDLCYCARHWLKGQSSPLVTAIVPMPAAFAGIDVGDRVLANGYAALMELSYFSDHRTEYVGQFGASLIDEVRNASAPADYTYLVGTKNGESDFSLEQLREMIAQDIFLDLTSDFAPHKRSIRDNIKSAWASQDPGGRGYPKNFMSFGLSTAEIPIAQIRTSMANRLATDFIRWWLNPEVQLPPSMLETVQATLKAARLTDIELLTDISSAGDRPYTAEISAWVNSIRNEIATDDKLQCTQQGVNMIGAEKGKILSFVESYLKPKVDDYRADHFRELSPDERLHGDYLQKMYDNRNKVIQQGRKALETEFYRILEDRTQGPKFADAFILAVRQIFDNAAERFRREMEKTWQPNETNRQHQYENALQDITHFKDKFGVTKQAKMEEFCEAALQGIEGTLSATIQRKARALGLEAIARLQEHLQELERRFARFTQKLNQTRDYFFNQANQQADNADALQINGIKLFDRQELNTLYQDLIEQQAGASEGSKTRYEIGMNGLCSTLSQDILRQTSPLWKETRANDEVMRLFDLPSLSDVREDDFREIIQDHAQEVIAKAPDSSRLKTELSACDRLFKLYKNDEAEITNNLRIAYNKSKPMILLSRAVMTGQDAGFTPAQNTKVALIGGRNTSNEAAKKLIPLIQEFVPSSDAITPLGDNERHRVVFVQEIGGFSLRCIEGMPQLRQSYQDWKGQIILAKRARLRGENRDLPIPVHIQKEPPFWDVFPEDPNVLKLVVQARALRVLRQEGNQSSKEQVIRYTRGTEIGTENIDLASSWEEAAQVLEVLACRPDREEIQKQVTRRLSLTETEAQKQTLFNQLMAYLQQREQELDKAGGKDSLEYKRESVILLELIRHYKLQTAIANVEILESLLPDAAVSLPVSTDNGATQAAPAPAPNSAQVFCTSCGFKNPASSNFCAKCGSKLTKVN